MNDNLINNMRVSEGYTFNFSKEEIEHFMKAEQKRVMESSILFLIIMLLLAFGEFLLNIFNDRHFFGLAQMITLFYLISIVKTFQVNKKRRTEAANHIPQRLYTYEVYGDNLRITILLNGEIRSQSYFKITEIQSISYDENLYGMLVDNRYYMLRASQLAPNSVFNNYYYTNCNKKGK